MEDQNETHLVVDKIEHTLFRDVYGRPGNIEILIFPIGSTKPHSDQRDQLIRKTSGILSGRNIDPITWQREIRSEWDNRK